MHESWADLGSIQNVSFNNLSWMLMTNGTGLYTLKELRGTFAGDSNHKSQGTQEGSLRNTFTEG